MRTTLDIADDVLLAAKSIARREKKSLGAVVSDLARSALLRPPATGAEAADEQSRRLQALGFTAFPGRGQPVTPELITEIREREGV